ncbi:uncharacterized protein LAESUDRAFT_55590 [Laetiporus sulphureus 93-53]|uniref:Uncharacterized protein n=1 Tax=Laetiporus sulphureus 93-53 TaxID=1314785 RepID=A0A165FD58_9APHY|nr:uncharacterized protein LAESUDRAFT_55590 [Laetiporus sulphureus 93-53]KZT08790.1 hypothetical protein LAESUDRAFT_55590 [Laetiporus sulphureus 93-53]
MARGRSKEVSMSTPVVTSDISAPISDIRSPTVHEPSSSQKSLRSYRTMKHRSISDTVVVMEQRRREHSALGSESPAGRQLRRMGRIVSCPAGDPRSPVPQLSNQFPGECRRRSVSDSYWNLRARDPNSSSTDSSRSSTSTSSSLYVTARSAFTEPTEVEEYHTILQVLDNDTGALFDKVFQGTGGEVTPTRLGEEIVQQQLEDAFCLVVPSIRLVRRSNEQANPIGPGTIPSFMLTMPTPQLPSSPIFMPQSPVTISKFVQASSIPGTSSRPPIPSIPICEACMIPQEMHQQCYSCEQQWLACKVWYQASDGGRRQRLTEPYIRPAESNAANRALIEMLGAPIGTSTAGVGLGIGASPEAVVSKSRFRRLAPLLALATADSTSTLGLGKNVLRADGRAKSALRKLGLPVYSSLKNVWTKTTNGLASRARQAPARFFKALLLPVRPRTTASCSQGLATQQSSLWNLNALLGLALAAPLPLAIASNSRFVEHLETPGTF